MRPAVNLRGSGAPRTPRKSFIKSFAESFIESFIKGFIRSFMILFLFMCVCMCIIKIKNCKNMACVCVY
jgi:hypothetical protein